jgi:hypothetical protein
MDIIDSERVPSEYRQDRAENQRFRVVYMHGVVTPAKYRSKSPERLNSESLEA